MESQCSQHHGLRVRQRGRLIENEQLHSSLEIIHSKFLKAQASKPRIAFALPAWVKAFPLFTNSA